MLNINFRLHGPCPLWKPILCGWLGIPDTLLTEIDVWPLAETTLTTLPPRVAIVLHEDCRCTRTFLIETHKLQVKWGTEGSWIKNIFNEFELENECATIHRLWNKRGVDCEGGCQGRLIMGLWPVNQQKKGSLGEAIHSHIPV